MGAHPMVTVDALEDLVGLEVSAVCFVRDYVEVHFDGPVLRSLADPSVYAPDRVGFPEEGSRDALCGLIGQTVRATRETSQQLILDFDGGRLAIPLRSDVAGPEAAHLVPFRDGSRQVARMQIWEDLGGGDPLHVK